ncbi:MAG: 5-formyltetrahydrofolate cyclo-ligase [Methyloligellaceae bacterium]
MNTSCSKQALRGEMMRRRVQLDANTREALSLSLADAGLSFISPPPGAVISGYAAIRDELDPLALLSVLAAQGHPIALPVTVAKSQTLIFRRWQPGAPLDKGSFNVPEPDTDARELIPDIVLAPLLAFDARGYRLGYGAGYYDRTLASLRDKKPTIAIGLAFDAQQVDEVPHDEHDQKLDWVLTPSGPIGVER